MSKNFPSQKGAYLVKVKTKQSTDRWSDFDRARLQISVGQSYHENQKLQAMIDWSISRFDHVQVCVNDTLQRFTLMFENDMDECSAHESAKQKGGQWIDRNQALWGGKNNIEVIRWDNWLDDNYASTRLKIEWLEAGNPTFKQAINENIMAIWNRRKREYPDLYTPENFSRFFELSKQYLLEEIAVFSMMFETKAVDVYPGTVIFAATVFQGQQIKNAPPGLGKGHFCRIDFSRNKNYSPQSEPRFG